MGNCCQEQSSATALSLEDFFEGMPIRTTHLSSIVELLRNWHKDIFHKDLFKFLLEKYLTNKRYVKESIALWLNSYFNTKHPEKLYVCILLLSSWEVETDLSLITEFFSLIKYDKFFEDEMENMKEIKTIDMDLLGEFLKYYCNFLTKTAIKHSFEVKLVRTEQDTIDEADLKEQYTEENINAFILKIMEEELPINSTVARFFAGNGKLLQDVNQVLGKIKQKKII